MKASQINFIRCKKLATIVSDQKNLTRSYAKLKYEYPKIIAEFLAYDDVSLQMFINPLSLRHFVVILVARN